MSVVAVAATVSVAVVVAVVGMLVGDVVVAVCVSASNPHTTTLHGAYFTK